MKYYSYNFILIVTALIIPISITDNYRDQPIRAEKDHRHKGTVISSNRNHDFLEHYFDNDIRESNNYNTVSSRPLTNNDDSFPSTIKSSSKVTAVIDECKNFMIVAAVLGCLLVAASVMMCILSHRLLRLSRKYKIEKLADVVAEHRRRFGAGGNGLVNGGGVLRFPHWSRQTGRVHATSNQIRQS